MNNFCQFHGEVKHTGTTDFIGDTEAVSISCPLCVAEAPHRVLILSCSHAKVDTPGRMLAINRYDGPTFKVYRKFQSEQSQKAAQIKTYILSAKFGLITDQTPIPNYEQKMTKTRAEEIKPEIAAYLRDSAYVGATGIMFCMSPLYRIALTMPVLREGVRIELTPGGIGKKIAKLRRWLHEESAERL